MNGDVQYSESTSFENSRWLSIVIIVGLPLLLVLLSVLFMSGPNQPWGAPSLTSPLGNDEFGRDVLGTAIIAAGLSLLKGLAMMSATLIIGLMAAEIITLSRLPMLPEAIKILGRIVESIPVVLWVLIVVIVLDGHRTIVAGVAFTLVVLPSAITIITGELFRLRHVPFVEAAYLMGVPERKVLVRHILPKAGAILFPFAIQILGGAIAVDGAIGVIGLGSRVDLDLGVFLIRGKENFLQHPQVLMIAIVMYAAIYLYLINLPRFIGKGQR